MRVEKTENQTAYGLLSRYRSALMGVATLWVMLFHAYPFEFGVLPLDAFKAVGFCGVDLFILLSGMGLSVSLQKRAGQERLGAYYRRRLSRILPAYWLVVGVYSLWLRLQGRISLTVAAWSMSTLHYWFDIPNSFNWYVPAQLAFYLIAPFYVGRLVRCRHREVPTLLAFPVSFALCRLSGILGVSYLTDFLYRIPAFAIGCLLGCYLLEGRELTARDKAMWGCLAVCGAVLGILRLTGTIYISFCYVITALAVPVCLLLCKGLEKLPWRGPERFLRLLGTNSLEIYLLNVVVTREFDTLAPLLDRGPRHLFYYAVVYTLNILLALLLHRGIEAVRSRWEKRAAA